MADIRPINESNLVQMHECLSDSQDPLQVWTDEKSKPVRDFIDKKDRLVNLMASLVADANKLSREMAIDVEELEKLCRE